MLCKANGLLHLFSHFMNFGCSGCQAANLFCVLLHPAQPKARRPGCLSLASRWFLGTPDQSQLPLTTMALSVMASQRISLHWLQASKFQMRAPSFCCCQSSKVTFIFNLRFGALAVRLEVIITINNRRYASSSFIFKVLYLGKPVLFIIPRRPLTEGKYCSWII